MPGILHRELCPLVMWRVSSGRSLLPHLEDFPRSVLAAPSSRMGVCTMLMLALGATFLHTCHADSWAGPGLCHPEKKGAVGTKDLCGQPAASA